jgi:uncharacterized membrane protein
MNPAHGLAARSRALAGALACLLALIVLGLAWELWLAPTGRHLALKVLPLLPAVAGPAAHRMYTYRWLSLLVWLYFTEGVVRATSEGRLPGNWLAMLERSLLCLALFAACALHVRLRLQRAALAAAARCTAGARHERPAARVAPYRRRRPMCWSTATCRLGAGLAQALARQGAGRGAPRQHRRGGAGGAPALRITRHRRELVPQGGNTGLVGGGVPDAAARQVLLSLQR